MKKVFFKLAVAVASTLAILGLNFKDAKAFVPSNSQVSVTTPLYLQDAGSLLNQAGGTNWHSSHVSHESHQSHVSHYSSR